MSKQRLKIAIFHLGFIYSGGGEKLVLEEARGLKKLGHEVEIFTPIVDGKCFPELLQKDRIKTFLPQITFITLGHEAFFVLLACVFAPIYAIRFRKFDVILAANQPSPWIAFFAKKFFKVPYVSYLAQPTRFLHKRKVDIKTGLTFSKRESFSLAAKTMRYFKSFINWADKVSIRNSDTVLANGEYIKAVLEKVYKVKAESCPAGAYPAKRIRNYESRIKGKIRVGKRTIVKPYLLITNRHFAQKRFEYGIFALSFLLEKFSNYSLVITGEETDYTDELRILINRLNLNSRVIFLGYVKERDLQTLYSNAAIYLYTAPEEDFGMGMIEAMVQGAPVVAWDNAGPTGIIKNGKSGFLAKPFLASDFAHKVSKLASEIKLAKRIGKQGFSEAKNRFSFESHIKILERHLQDVC